MIVLPIFKKKHSKLKTYLISVDSAKLNNNLVKLLEKREK